MEMIIDNFSPSLSDSLIVAKDHIIRVKFHHFLQADHNEIDIISREVEKFIQIFLLKGSWIHHITVPCYNIYSIFLMRTVFEFLVFQNFACDVILEILHAGGFLFFVTEQIVQTLLLG